jgi:hypothetical protein
VADSDDKIEFTRNVYTPYNQAVQTELSKHSAILETLKSERFVSYMQGFVLICIGVAVLLLASIFAYKYFIAEPVHVLPTTEPKVQSDLTEITSAQDDETINDTLIRTRYTVFHDSITDTGEHVITGLEYSPLDTKKPVRQYCYLQLGKSAQEMIAEIKDGIIITMTQQLELKEYPSLYCKFVAA